MTDRQTKILEIVNQKKKVEVATLSQMLEVSQVTIRKDLDALEELNFLTREHGYATMKNMSDISNRMAFCYETKQRIAEKASEIISDGETIMVESGSSCALLVKYLSETKKDITVITNSSYIARFIRETEGGVTKVIVLGGEYQKEAEVMVGPLVKTCAEAFYVDTAGVSRLHRDADRPLLLHQGDGQPADQEPPHLVSLLRESGRGCHHLPTAFLRQKFPGGGGGSAGIPRPRQGRPRGAEQAN